MTIFNIPPAANFLQILAIKILREPINSLILLPTRRYCLSLQTHILQANDGKPVILPSIQPIADTDLDILIPPEINNIPPAMGNTERLFILSRLIYDEMEITLNMEHAMALANALCNLIDEMTRAEINLINIKNIVTDEFANHWQITLNFLDIIIEKYPKILENKGLISVGERRIKSINLLTNYWLNNPPNNKIIIAGSTGSVPSVANLIAVIAKFGDVYLPALDMNLTETSWNNLPKSHAQYNLKNLLKIVGTDRKNITSLNN